jgi:outer membrane lipoprotein-sorting protein
MLKKSLILFMIVSLLIAVTGCEKGKGYAETANQNTASTENAKATAAVRTQTSQAVKTCHS